MSYINILSEDRDLITYRPRLRKIAGSVTATILLQQIIFRWKNVGRRPFYKFIEPCEHERYKKGDSWAEELGFSRQEFTTAIKKIGKKITRGISKTDALKDNIVVYWTDANRMTWFELNEELLESKLHYLYNEGSSNYIELEEPHDTFFTETTTEITTNTGCNAGEKPTAEKKLAELRQKYPADPLAATVNAHKQLDNNSDRPNGWRDATDEEYAVCRRVASLWCGGQLSWSARDIENDLAAANHFLSLLGNDVRKAVRAIDEYYAAEGSDLTIVSTYSLRRVLPKFIRVGSKQASDDCGSVTVLPDGRKRIKIRA